MWTLSALLLALPLFSTLVHAQQCSAQSKCPASAPCCSPYGYCGSGSYCLGGCEPLFSNTPTSCLPNPICQSTTTDFTSPASLSRVQTNASLWNGNATAYDWVVDTGSVVQESDGLRLLLTEGKPASGADTSQGTKLSSTRYMLYGSVVFTLETSRWPGVVTAAITMSDVKDEIDLEWIAATGQEANVQTNYWYMGVANYSDSLGEAAPVGGNTGTAFHTYQLDWHEDQMVWSVDGTQVRTVNKSDTLGSDGTYAYPSTPSRIQLSIWPAGISSSAPGTITWAGGLIDWTAADYTANGYYWNTVQSVEVYCQADAGANASTTGWAYAAGTGGGGGAPTVEDTTAKTYLASSALSQRVGSAAAVLVTLGGALAVIL